MEAKIRRKVGDVYSFGWNRNGQLGLGESGGWNDKPIMSNDLKKFVNICTFANFSVGLTAAGTVTTWGSNQHGELGNGEFGQLSGPPRLIDKSKKGTIFCAVGSSHALIVREREILSWGLGENGRLGHGDIKNVLTPTLIAALNGKRVSSISCGSDHSAAVVEGYVYTWGKGEMGRLGHGDESDQLVPKLVSGIEGVAKEVACGADWTAVLTGTGDVWAFGNGAYGHLGLNSEITVSTPKLVEALKGKNIVSIACGNDHTLCITEDGDVYSYGCGANGRLGHSGERDERKPKLIEALRGKGIVQVSCGGFHSGAISSSGEVFLWGWNHFGQLGFEPKKGLEDETLPIIIPLDPKKKAILIACGEGHTLVLVS